MLVHALRSGAVATSAATLTLLLGASPWALSATGQPQAADPRVSEVRGLVRVVYAALRGQSPDGAPFGWSSDFFKGADGSVYIPFTVTVDRAKLRTPTAALYILVTPHDAPRDRGWQLPGRPSTSEPDELQGPPPPAIAFEAVYFVDLSALTVDPTTGVYRFSRAFSLPPGDYELFVALAESSDGPAGAVARRERSAADVILIKRSVSVPDLWADELTTSTLVLVDRVEPLEVPLPEPQVSDPYALGAARLVPVADADFQPTDQLAVTFFIYNSGLTAERLPDVTVDYLLYRRGPAGDTYFSRTNPQRFNAQTMVGFEADAGHQIVAGHAIPLETFPEGAYRLDVRVTDQTSGSTVVRSVNFTVSGPSIDTRQP